MTQNRVYEEEHSILDLELLDRGYEIREGLEGRGLSPDAFREELEVRLGYVRARIPEEFWEKTAETRAPARAVWKELQSYFERAEQVRKLGLGLTLIGSGVGYRTQALYVVCRELVDRGFSCFVVTYDELVYFLKETWNDGLLKRELGQRFGVDFFALVEIPGGDEVAPAVKQDLLARVQLRRARNLSTIFSVNTAVQSIDDIPPESLLARLVFPFVRVNKPITVEELGDAGTLHMSRWSLLDGEN